MLFMILAAQHAAASGRAYVLTNNTLVTIDTANPAASAVPLTLAGVAAGDVLVGIDVRPQNGFLYALGHNGGAGTVQLYAISARTGQAAPVGATGAFVTADGTTPVPIAGTNFGFDFNPVTDRIRVVTNAGQNFRIDPNTGAFVDGDLNNVTPIPGVNMDGPISGVPGSWEGAAYTNNQQNAAMTGLFLLDAASNALWLQPPSGSGVLTTPMTVTLNGTPLDFGPSGGFDILPNVNIATNGDIAAGNGIAALTVGGTTSLYTIDLMTGVAVLIGAIGDGTDTVQGLALAGEAVPGGLPSIALTTTNSLVRFNTGQVAAAAPVAVTGLVAGETLVGIDWRPRIGQLMALGFNRSNGTGSATLYRLDPQTGVATIIGAPNGVADGAGNPIDFNAAIAFGFDVDPTSDRIRVVTDNELNLQLDADMGVLAAADTAIVSDTGQGTGITGAAYTNSFGQTPGGVTTLYTLDAAYESLYIQDPPSSGLQTRRLGLHTPFPVDVSAVNGFDIPPPVRVSNPNTPADGPGYALLADAAGTAGLYKIELSTGEAERIGVIGGGLPVLSGLTVGDGPRAVTRTTVSSSANPIQPNQAVTFTATVSPSTATGTINFDGGYYLAPCQQRPIVAGIATCTITAPSTSGDLSIVARYSGDNFHFVSHSQPIYERVAFYATTTSLSVRPSVAALGQTVTLTATVDPPGVTGNIGHIVFMVDGRLVATVPMSGNVAAIGLSTLSVGLHTVTATYSGDFTHEMSSSAPTPLTITERFTQYFAEGATGFFQTDIGILNASTTDTANVNVTLFPEAGTPSTLLFTMPPLARRTIDINELLGSTQGVSTLVAADRPVAATRQMTWGDPVYGSTLESGISQTSATWYFAEGATNVFSLFYLIENPGLTDAGVTLTHLLEGGGAPIVQSVTVPASSRRTLSVNDVPGLSAAAVSTVITSTVPIVAERAMYLNTSRQPFVGGTAGRGAAALSTVWSFAEGATGFFHTYLLFGNPNTDVATVSVRYHAPDGTTIEKSYEVPGQSRRTVDVNVEAPLLASTAVAVSLTSTLPVVAERAMWWGEPFNEGSVALGSTATGAVWAIGEGAEGGAHAESTFVLVSNGSANAGTLRFTLVYDDGTTEAREYSLLPDARLTVRVGDDFARAADAKFSVLVESLTDGVPITVEAARYQSGDAILGAGGAAPATRIR